MLTVMVTDTLIDVLAEVGGVERRDVCVAVLTLTSDDVEALCSIHELGGVTAAVQFARELGIIPKPAPKPKAKRKRKR